MIPHKEEREKMIIDRRTSDGNQYPHVSQLLVDRLKEEFKHIYETPTPLPGEMTKKALNSIVQKQFSVGRNKADELIEITIGHHPDLKVKRRRSEDSGIIFCYTISVLDEMKKRVPS